MHASELMVENADEGHLELFLEPWGISLSIPPHTAYRVVATAEHPGEFEVEHGIGAVTVYAWPSSTIAVYEGERLVFDIPIAAPGMPEDMSMSGMLRVLFGPSQSRY
jgi:hypothetical protein